MLKRKKLILVGVILAALFSFVIFIRSQYVFPILMYHTVYPDAPYANRLAVSTKTFERQMRFLKEHKFNVVPLEEAARLIINKKKIPPRTVAITLDDGYKDNYVYAFPILKKYKIPATIFVIINEVGRAQGDRLSWDDILAMRDFGLITFGSHTLGPEPLPNIKSQEEVKRQIVDSKRILEEKLAREVKLFSYPEGSFTPQIRQMVVDSGYIAAVATHPRGNYPKGDVFLLRRVRVSENASNMFLFWLETSGYSRLFKWHKRK